MNVEELLEQLDARQVELWLDGGLLRFRVPEGKLDNVLLAQMRLHKAKLIERLSQTAAQTGGQDEERDYPISMGQEALYFLHSLAPQSPAYNVALALRIRSPIDRAALERALEQLVMRHELLRATFELRNGETSCRVSNQPQIDFQTIDATGLGSEPLHASVRAEYERPFQLATGPLFRVRLFTVAPEDHVLLLTLHHIIFDFWSLWLIHDELPKLYTQQTSGSTALLPSPDARYADFVKHQRATLESSRGEQLWEYWQQQLAPDPTPVDLPCDFAPPDRSSFSGATHHFELCATLSEKLRRLAASSGATPFMVLMALFKLLLHKHSGQTDLIVGTTTSGRSSEFKHTVGYFVNTMAIRSTVNPNDSFSDLLAQLRTQTLGAIEHQDYPFPLLIRRLNPTLQRGHQPICNAMFGLQKPQPFSGVETLLRGEEQAIDWGGLSVQQYDLDQQEGQSDLTLELFDTGAQFVGALKYSSELFRCETVIRMADRLKHLAEQIVEDASTRIRELDAVSPAERDQLLRCGGSQSVAGAPSLVSRMFERTAVARPRHTAVESSEGSLTYDQLNRKANQLARFLQEQGVTVGTRVGCWLKRGLDVPVAILAIWKAGGVYVPIDRANPAERSARIIEDCGEGTVVLRSDDEHKGRLQIETAGLPSTTRALDFRWNCDRLEHQDDSNLESDFEPDSLAYVLFTSGSTGQPKGVCVSHRAITAHVDNIRSVFGTTADDRVLQFSNLGFDPSIEQMLVPWSVGATVVFPDDSLPSADAFLSELAKQEVSVCNIPPAYFRECSEEFSKNPRPIPSLRLLIVGGDQFPTEAAGAWSGLDVQILNAYGPTEAVITATTFAHSPRAGQSPNTPIGRPRPGTRAYVLDDFQRLVPVGAIGELCLAGEALADGYLGDDQLTSDKFLPDPFWPSGGRMYRTGDLVRWSAAGQLEFVGRRDSQIKVNGVRLETGEIETILARCRSVRQCHVGLLPSPQAGRAGEVRLVAWVVPPTGMAPDPHEFREYLDARLPRYMVPRQFVTIDALPLTVSGKVDARALPCPPPEKRTDFVGPRNDVESALVKIWSDTLETSEIGVFDSFFDLGGGSLTSLRIASRATELGLVEDGQPIAPDLLFRFPTIAELASKLTWSGND